MQNHYVCDDDVTDLACVCVCEKEHDMANFHTKLFINLN